MMKIDRTPFEQEPDVKLVIDASLTWDGNGKFQWETTIDGKKYNIKKLLMPHLLKMTSSHCSFCDYHPLSSDFFDIPLEHFYPKCKNCYPQKAYTWENLFPSCNGCTRCKGDKFDKNLLKPDENYYCFEMYFFVTGDGKITPASSKDPSVTDRAKTTIDIYQLNRGELLTQRKKWVSDFKKLCPIKNPDEYPFRFLIPFASASINADEVINSFIQ